MPAETNFKIFNEANDASTTFNDSEYQNATQRLTGVTPGMALSRMHNKMFRQWSVMCKAIADMMVAKGYSAMDDNEQQIAEDLQSIIDAAASDLGYLLRKNSTQYAVGDIAFSASLPSSLVLKCTTAGTTASTEPDFSGATVGGTVTDGNVLWTYMPLGTLSREITPAFNKRDIITTSGTYTAPVTGWYKITVKGGGGGGYGGGVSTSQKCGGRGGGEAGTTIGFEKMTAGQTASVIIGAGGAGGAANQSSSNGGAGGIGGDSTVTINNNSYVGGGGRASGGTGTIAGAASTAVPIAVSTGNSYGTGGAGAGGGHSGTTVASVGMAGIAGGGGAGGNAGGGSNVATNGGAGGDGYVWFEYWDPSLQ